MSLKCSIFGHKYGPPDVDRERNEQGSEVVITIRELETCVRCGQTRVVSENKEVTTLETPGMEAGGTPDGAASAAPAETGGLDDEGAVAGSARSGHAEEATDAEIIDEQPAPTGASDADSDGGPAASTESRGAAGEGSRSAGAADSAAGDSEGSPPTADDGVILDAEDGSGGRSSERRPGEWPQESDEEDEPEWVAETEPAPHTVEERSPEIESAASAVSVPDGEFYCTECGFTASIEASSLRDGDFCPDCHQGTLQTRPAGE
ncbi:MAG: hypothetical protein V5A43_08570 [Haloarculaceae archaeon]